MALAPSSTRTRTRVMLPAILRAISRTMLMAVSLAMSSACGLDPGTQIGGTEQGGEASGGEEAKFEVTLHLSPVIDSVGIVEWSTPLGEVEAAHIEFRQRGRRIHRAPVDLLSPNYRTLLLGMKAGSQYLVRVVAVVAGQTHYSQEYRLNTPSPPSNLPRVKSDLVIPEQRSGNFIVSNFFAHPFAFIVDGDGDYVWWARARKLRDITSARMSYDGKYMFLVPANNAGGKGAIEMLSMDGLEHYVLDYPGATHDITTANPDGIVAFIEHSGDCDRIVELNPFTKARRIVFELRDHHAGRCHSNVLHYWPADDSYTLSVLHADAIYKVDRDGNIIWVFGGEQSTFRNAEWNAQHGHQLIDDRIVFFNNLSERGSRVLEYRLDPAAGEAELLWNYTSGQKSQVLGDTQRLHNGNTLAVYSIRGVMHEVNPQAELVQSLIWSLGGATGFATSRPSLYGPPPR